MLIEKRQYTIVPGRLGEFLVTYEREVFPVISKYARLEGAFTRDSGEFNVVEFLWRYDGFDHRSERRIACAADPAWSAAVASILPLITHQENWFLKPTAFSPDPSA